MTAKINQITAESLENHLESLTVNHLESLGITGIKRIKKSHIEIRSDSKSCRRKSVASDPSGSYAYYFISD